MAGDLAQATTAGRVVELALDRFGRIDPLVNNAGIFIRKSFTDYTPDGYAAVTAVNLAGFFHITQRAIRQMLAQGSGHIVNITTSLADKREQQGTGRAGLANEGGLAAVTRSLANEYASTGVRVKAVAPGVIETAAYDAASYEAMASPVGRLGEISASRRRDPGSLTRHVRHRRDAARRRRPRAPVA